MIVCVRTRNLRVVASDNKPVKTCDIITFDITCLNETRLNCSIDNSEVGIPGYDLARKDRNRNGGGVAIYLRDTIPYIDRADLIPDVAEAICLEIKKQKMKPLVVLALYVGTVSTRRPRGAPNPRAMRGFGSRCTGPLSTRRAIPTRHAWISAQHVHA